MLKCTNYGGKKLPDSTGLGMALSHGQGVNQRGDKARAIGPGRYGMGVISSGISSCIRTITSITCPLVISVGCVNRVTWGHVIFFGATDNANASRVTWGTQRNDCYLCCTYATPKHQNKEFYEVFPLRMNLKRFLRHLNIVEA